MLSSARRSIREVSCSSQTSISLFQTLDKIASTAGKYRRSCPSTMHFSCDWPMLCSPSRAEMRCQSAKALQKQVGFVCFQASASSIEATTDVSKCSREAHSGLDRYANTLKPPTSLLLMRMARTGSAAKRSNTILGEPIDSCSLYAESPKRLRRVTIDGCYSICHRPSRHLQADQVRRQVHRHFDPG